MKKLLQIAATIDEPLFLENLIEKLAYTHYDMGYGNADVPKGYEALETSTSEIYISGDIGLSDSEEQINMPYITSFFFTCIKSKDGIYKLAFSSSLS